MELMVLDRNFINQKVIDIFESLIWSDRYNEYGDFELYLPMNSTILQYIKVKNYLIQRDSDHGMIIEKIKINFDTDGGTHLTVTGRSLEQILTKRIVWTQTRFRGKLDICIKKLLNDSIISPKNENRVIPNFIYEETNDPYIKDITIDKQFTGDTVYEAVKAICDPYRIGFKIRLENEQFIFNLYHGSDRSYEQLINPYVIFSPNFENLTTSEYKEDYTNEKNVCLIAGEDSGTVRRTYVIEDESRGIDRSEMYVDARDIQSEEYDEDGNEVIIPEEEYMELLKSRGEEKMLDYTAITEFSGEAETTKTFKYGEDFFMGDVVQVEDGWGHYNKVYISEIIFSQSESGYSINPTFEIIDEEVIKN